MPEDDQSPPPKKQRKIKPKTPADQAILDDLQQEAQMLDAQWNDELHRLNGERTFRFGRLNNMPENGLGHRISSLRQSHGWTQQELSDQTKAADVENKGISRAVLSLYERGTNKPGPRELRILCETFRRSPSYLIYGESDPFQSELEYSRIFGSDIKLLTYAKLLYCFNRLGRYDRESIAQLMFTILRREKNFDADLQQEAIPTFLEIAEQLKQAVESNKLRIDQLYDPQ